MDFSKYLSSSDLAFDLHPVDCKNLFQLYGSSLPSSLNYVFCEPLGDPPFGPLYSSKSDFKQDPSFSFKLVALSG